MESIKVENIESLPGRAPSRAGLSEELPTYVRGQMSRGMTAATKAWEYVTGHELSRNVSNMRPKRISGKQWVALGVILYFGMYFFLLG